MMIQLAYRDIQMAIILVISFIMMALLVMAKQEAVKTPPAPGQIAVIATWQEGDSDVDLWLSGPTEPTPIGYSNKNGAVWDLLRDDLGISTNDVLGTNFENAYTHGIPDGEYIVNVHAYGITDKLPFKVGVEVTMSDGTNTFTIAAKTVEFDVAGEEITVVRFQIKNGKLVHGSQHGVAESLRGGGK